MGTCRAVRSSSILSAAACLYLDGQQVAEETDTLGSYVLERNDLFLGRDGCAVTFPLNGDLAHARIWARALSAEELAGFAVSNAVPSEGLVALYAPMLTNSLRTAGVFRAAGSCAPTRPPPTPPRWCSPVCRGMCGSVSGVFLHSSIRWILFRRETVSRFGPTGWKC